MSYKYLEWNDRLMIERMLRKNFKRKAIASAIGCTPRTLYNEIKRGLYPHTMERGAKVVTVYRYSPNKAQDSVDYAQTSKGRDIKLGHRYDLAKRIADLIIKEDCSPYVALQRVNAPFCLSTLYSYIDKGYIPGLTNADLPAKPHRKRPYNQVHKAKRSPAGTSIEKRPAFINDRKIPGDWEMDCVQGKIKGYDEACLVLTERKTRAELIFKLHTKKAKSVVSILNRLQEKTTDFSRVFHSITVDNGSEFADAYGMSHDRHGNRRTYIYYCHPFTSCERGSNENANRLVRRWFPKRKSMSRVTQADCLRAMDWQNNYERRIFDGETPAQRFRKEFGFPIEDLYL